MIPPGLLPIATHSNSSTGAEVPVAAPESETLKGLEALDVRRSEGFESEEMLSLAGVDTGENGFFARGEFEAITYLGQMEFVTPQEIAERALHEISGRNTGKDVVQGLAGAVLDPSYRGGFLRPIAISDLVRMEEESGTPSVAIGQLGPPQLTKLLQRRKPRRRAHASTPRVSPPRATPRTYLVEPSCAP